MTGKGQLTPTQQQADHSDLSRKKAEQKRRKQEGKAWPAVLRDLCHRRRKGRCLCGNGLTTNEQNGKSKIDQRNKENLLECLALKVSWRMISDSINGNKRQRKNKFQSQNSCTAHSTKIKTARKTSKGNIGNYKIKECGGSFLKIKKKKKKRI